MTRSSDAGTGPPEGESRMGVGRVCTTSSHAGSTPKRLACRPCWTGSAVHRGGRLRRSGTPECPRARSMQSILRCCAALWPMNRSSRPLGLACPHRTLCAEAHRILDRETCPLSRRKSQVCCLNAILLHRPLGRMAWRPVAAVLCQRPGRIRFTSIERRPEDCSLGTVERVGRLVVRNAVLPPPSDWPTLAWNMPIEACKAVTPQSVPVSR